MATTRPDDTAKDQDDLRLTLDALVRSIGVKRSTPHVLFLGAGASVSSGIPSAESCIWEWKRILFLTKNPGLENQFTELSLPSVQERIQSWLDRQGTYPRRGDPEEYAYYIQECFPIAGDRRAFFQEKVRLARPHTGYRLLCHLAKAGLFRSVWSTNFDGLPARATADFSISPIEVGIDTQERLVRVPNSAEMLCVSLHGDYRYDLLKNTAPELQKQEATLRQGLISEAINQPVVICGYSGRDESVMEAFSAAMTTRGAGTLYWCGYGDGEIPTPVESLLRDARSKGRQAYYVPAMGYDDVMVRLALHCLEGEAREQARKDIADTSSPKVLARVPFQVTPSTKHTVIKSNAFEIQCPSEVLSFDLKSWPKTKVWSWLSDELSGKEAVAVPLRGKVIALGTIDDFKDVFGDNIKGPVERAPVGPDELRFEDGSVSRLMREALVRSMARTASVETDGNSELWFKTFEERVLPDRSKGRVHESVLVFLRQIGGSQYVVLKPSIKVLGANGQPVPRETAGPIKLAILGYQHNKPFNEAVNKWRALLFPEGRDAFEFPVGIGSTFKFKVRRSPVFGRIGVARDSKSVTIPEKLEPLLKHSGIELGEPKLFFCNRRGTGLVGDAHPISGLVNNRPYDFQLTATGLSPSLRVGVICAKAETGAFRSYLQKVHLSHAPSPKERDYLVDYPGFQQAYGLPIEMPEPGSPGWVVCGEPSGADGKALSLSTARGITAAIDALRSSYAPNVIIICYPNRWREFRGFKTEYERFDVHDFTKAYAVQRGVSTQFLDQDTTNDSMQARVWWWLSLALYAKAMRTPWVLDGLDDDTAYVGLGFSIDHNAQQGTQVVLGCSHIYSSRGEGLLYRLSKVENPIIRGKNPFMSRDDARRTGETIRQLFFDARMKLPRRVVLHKKTPFLKEEREGLVDGLGGVAIVDMVEIQIDNALRYVASQAARDGSIDNDNYPVKRGTVLKVDDYTALLWVHGVTSAVNAGARYYQGKRRIPAPLTLRRHTGSTPLEQLGTEILGLSKMNWNTFDLYTKFPATLHSSGEIARIGSLLTRFGASSYDYRLFF